MGVRWIWGILEVWFEPGETELLTPNRIVRRCRILRVIVRFVKVNVNATVRRRVAISELFWRTPSNEEVSPLLPNLAARR